VDQSASLSASKSSIHPRAREWQQAFSERPAIANKSLDLDDVDSKEGLPAETTQFSASLADGTIVNLKHSVINLSQFKGLVLTISKIWKQHSDKIIPHLSAQKIGIGIHKGVYHSPDVRQDVLHTAIYDAGVGGGQRKIFSYLWSISADRSQFSCLHHNAMYTWKWAGRTGIRSGLVNALKNYIGSVDQHGSLMMLSSPVAHALYSKFQQYEESFVYNLGPYKGEPMSVVLGENAIVTPIPASIIAMTRAELLSLAVPIWQWWRRERPSVRQDQHGSITNIRIMHVTRSDGVAQANSGTENHILQRTS
jgi:hypothetical protein